MNEVDWFGNSCPDVGMNEVDGFGSSYPDVWPVGVPSCWTNAVSLRCSTRFARG